MSTDTPQLLDIWQKIVPLRKPVEKIVRNATPTARRFVFDSEACKHVGDLLRHAGDLVAEQILFAKPPYPNTYLEISDARAMFRAWRPEEQNNPLTSDDKIGILYVGDRLYTMCSSDTTDVPATVGMFSVQMGHGQTMPLANIFGTFNDHFETPAGHHNWRDQVKLAYLLGGMRQTDGILMVSADYQWFLDNYDLSSTLEDPPPGYRTDRHRTMVESAFLGGGDLLIGAACLLLIHGHQRGLRNISIRSQPHHRGWYRSRP